MSSLKDLDLTHLYPPLKSRWRRGGGWTTYEILEDRRPSVTCSGAGTVKHLQVEGMTHLPQLHSAPFGFGQKLEVSSCKLLSSLPFGSSCQVFGIKGTKKNEFTERS